MKAIRIRASVFLPSFLAVTLSVLLLGTSREVAGQTPSNLSPEEKTTGFVQHLVKVARLDPARYRALVLEYEIGRAIDELRAIEHESHDHGTAAREACCGGDSFGFAGVDFIDKALGEIFPRYGEIKALREKGDDRKAREVARDLAASADPYVSAYAQLRLAELDFEGLDGSPEACQRVMTRCEEIVRKQRLYLIADYRASEMIARCYQMLDKPLFELVQYTILLVDFQHLPDEVSSRAKSRVTELAKTVTRPLGQVSTWMGAVERLLDEEVTGEDPTQDKETQVLAALDKLIELQEAKERNTCGSCGSGNCNGSCQGPPKGNRSNGPARVSALAQAEGRVLLHGVSRGDPGTIWGQLKDKDGLRALQSYSGKLPSRYEKLLEQYFKDLSKSE